MPLSVPNTTVTVDYVEFGGGRGYANGYIFVANGLVDVLLHHGDHPGLEGASGPFTLPPGFTPVSAIARDLVTGFSIRAFDRTLSTPAQQFAAAMWEPGRAFLSPAVPFTDLLSPGGQVTPPSSGVDSIAKLGDVQLTGDVTVSAGSGIAIVEAGQNLQFSNTQPAPARKLIACWAGLRLPTTASNGLVWRVPYNSDGSSFAFTLTRAYARTESTFTSATQFRLEKSPGGNVPFVPTTITTVTIGAGSYETENTGLATTVNSGELLRLVFAAVGSTSTYQVQLVGSE